MSVVATSTPVTDALLVALRAIGRPVGDGVKPSSPNPPPVSFYPYAVLYSGTVSMQGTLVDPNEDGVHRAQVTSIGRDRAGAEWMRDQVRTVLLDRTLDIDGHAVVWSELVTSQPTRRDDDVSPPVFYCVDIVDLLVTPTATGS